MKIEGFREELVNRRNDFLEWHPDYALPEATAAVAVDAARRAVYKMVVKLGKFEEANLILSSGEIKKRGEKIEGSPAYQSFGARISAK